MANHDSCVENIASGYSKAGWTVYADLEGYEAPSLIGGKKPDVYATYRNSEIVFEVETDESMDSDHAKEQRAAFKQWASQSSTKSFNLYLANAQGCNKV